MAKLIDKDALVAEIEKRLKYNSTRAEIDRSAVMAGRGKEDEDILSFLYTLEVKEVDLEKEANEAWNYVFSALGWDENTRMTMTHKEFMAFAKHFFELGLKAKQG